MCTVSGGIHLVTTPTAPQVAVDVVKGVYSLILPVLYICTVVGSIQYVTTINTSQVGVDILKEKLTRIFLTSQIYIYLCKGMNCCKLQPVQGQSLHRKVCYRHVIEKN